MALSKLVQLRVLVPVGRDEHVRVAACLAVGAFAGWLAIGPASAPKPTPLPAVTLDGVALSLEGGADETLERARAIARAYVERPLAVAAGGEEKVKTREELGARVESTRLEALVAALHDARSPLRRAYAQHVSAGVAQPLRLPLPVSVDGERALASMLLLKDDLDRAPVDAKVDLASSSVDKPILADQPGRRMDVYATLARLDAALVKGEPRIEAIVETVPAERTAAQIAGVHPDEVLGYFETRYNEDAKHEARSYNLRIAAQKLDGYVLLPGETFDFNTVVGPRTEANGYRVAPVIAQGELVDGIGGGTCQVAGTLHGAAFFAGLGIPERKPHTRPSFYIKMGLDAAVAYPTITLKLKNDFPHPIVLHETVQGGVVRAEILGPKRTRDVTFVRKITDVVPFKEREVDDPKLPTGERVLSQRGIPGFKITRERVIREGEDVKRERTTDAYPPTTQVWRIGTGDRTAKSEANDDEHPEYVVDEQLTLTQGPGVVDPRRTPSKEAEPGRGGPTVESREPGKYGTRGWTVRLGFAKAVNGTRATRAHRR
jgi:vancomycin resistance protein YoaR